ncbi:MAG: hypothetical protein ACHQM6_05895, partial [Candidatus Kapaibacterium sp.]
LFAVLIFGFQYLPIQDYPVLLYQGFVFNQVVFHGFNFGGFFHFHSYLPPNAISTIIMGFMDLLFDPFVTGKIYLFFLAIAIYSGLYRYLVFHLNQRKTAFAAFAFLLTLNMHFLMGYLNFLTGLAIILHAIVVFREYNYYGRYLPMAAVFLLIYLCHFATFALFVLYFFLFFLIKKNYRGLARMMVSAVPAIAIFLHYLFSRTIPILPLKESYENVLSLIHWKLIILFAPLIPFTVFKWVQEIPMVFRVADYVFIAIVLLLFIYSIVKHIASKEYPFEFYLAFTTFLIALFIPLNFGGVIPAGERVIALCAVNTFILLFRDKINPFIRRIGLIVCVLLGIASYSYSVWNTELFNSMVRRNEIPQDAIIHESWKLEGTNGFLHLHFYDDILQKRPYAFFEIGLFEYPAPNKNQE